MYIKKKLIANFEIFETNKYIYRNVYQYAVDYKSMEIYGKSDSKGKTQVFISYQETKI